MDGHATAWTHRAPAAAAATTVAVVATARTFDDLYSSRRRHPALTRFRIRAGAVGLSRQYIFWRPTPRTMLTAVATTHDCGDGDGKGMQQQ